MMTFLAPHHINFYKPSSDPMDIILMGTLHRRLSRYVEPRKDLDYYTVMRTMRDSFEKIQAPSFWNNKLKYIYYEKIKFIINQWNNKGHLRVLGLTPSVLASLYKQSSSLITKEYIEDLIEYLESQTKDN